MSKDKNYDKYNKSTEREDNSNILKVLNSLNLDSWINEIKKILNEHPYVVE